MEWLCGEVILLRKLSFGSLFYFGVVWGSYYIISTFFESPDGTISASLCTGLTMLMTFKASVTNNNEPC